MPGQSPAFYHGSQVLPSKRCRARFVLGEERWHTWRSMEEVTTGLGRVVLGVGPGTNLTGPDRFYGNLSGPGRTGVSR